MHKKVILVYAFLNFRKKLTYLITRVPWTPCFLNWDFEGVYCVPGGRNWNNDIYVTTAGFFLKQINALRFIKRYW